VILLQITSYKIIIIISSIPILASSLILAWHIEEDRTPSYKIIFMKWRSLCLPGGHLTCPSNCNIFLIATEPRYGLDQ